MEASIHNPSHTLERAGVGINRITGAAQNGALYDFEVVEDGSFLVEMTFQAASWYNNGVLAFIAAFYTLHIK